VPETLQGNHPIEPVLDALWQALEAAPIPDWQKHRLLKSFEVLCQAAFLGTQSADRIPEGDEGQRMQIALVLLSKT